MREDFRERWSEFYTAQRNGDDPEQLAAIKADLLTEQKDALALRRDAACAELRETRDEFYRTLLGGQRETRYELRARQEAGLESAEFLEDLRGHDLGFREAARAFGQPQERTMEATESEDTRSDAEPRESVADSHLAAHAGAKIGGAALGLLTGWFVEFTNGPAVPEVKNTNDLFNAAADEAQKRQQREAREEDERAWREKERTRVWD